MTQDRWLDALDAWNGGDFKRADEILAGLQVESAAPADVFNLAGCVKLALDQPAEAVLLLEKALVLDPVNARLLAALGNAHRRSGNLVRAREIFEKAPALGIADPALEFNHGCLLKDVGNLQRAAQCFSRAAELDPCDAQEAWMQAGLAYHQFGDFENSASAFLKASEADGPDRYSALREYGLACADLGRPETACSIFARCHSGPIAECDDLRLLSQWLYCKLELCDWREIECFVDRCITLLALGERPAEPFTFLLIPQVSAAAQRHLTATFVEPMLSASARSEPASPRATADGRIRIGYLSSDFRDHPVGRLIVDVLEHHDRASFEIHLFSYSGADRSAWRDRIVAACDGFHDVSEKPLAELAAAIRGRAIDILVDLTGWTGNTRTPVLALRPAPIQVNWLGYTATLGSRVLADYLIGDGFSTPAGSEAWFAETIARLPICCMPCDTRRPIPSSRDRSGHGLPASAVVLACFARPLKIIPELFDTWCRILVRFPDACLWLLQTSSSAQTNLMSRARELGVSVDRLIFAPRRPLEQYLGQLHVADLVLDTYPYGSHTMVSDALWVGTPVIALAGESFQSRVSACQLHALGLDELIADSVDAYGSILHRMIAGGARRQELRELLAASRDTAALYDARRFARDIEERYREFMRERSMANPSPQDPTRNDEH